MSQIIYPIIAMYTLTIALALCKIKQKKPVSNKIILTSGITALTMHTALLISIMFAGKNGMIINIPTANSLINIMIGVFFIAFINREKFLFLLPAVYSFSILSVILLSFFQYETNLIQPKLEIIIHAATSLIAYSIFIIASLYAVQLQITRYILKNKKIIQNQNLFPSVVGSEKMIIKLVKMGVICLTISLLTGIIFIDNFFQIELRNKVIISITAWLLYMHMIYQSYKHGCKTTTYTLYTISGGVLLTSAYFGTKIIKDFMPT